MSNFKIFKNFKNISKFIVTFRENGSLFECKD